MAAIDMTQVFCDLDGKPVIENGKPVIENGKPVIVNGKPLIEKSVEVTLRNVCCEALLAVFPNENEMGEQKLKRWILAEEIHTHNTVDLQAEDISLLKKRIGEGFGPAVVGPAWKMLDPLTMLSDKG